MGTLFGTVRTRGTDTRLKSASPTRSPCDSYGEGNDNFLRYRFPRTFGWLFISTMDEVYRAFMCKVVTSDKLIRSTLRTAVSSFPSWISC
jgi:hypothetical protein